MRLDTINEVVVVGNIGAIYEKIVEPIEIKKIVLKNQIARLGLVVKETNNG